MPTSQLCGSERDFFILQILMSYYLFVAVCHIINLLVRQSVYAAPHRIIDEYFIMPQINSNARTKIYCKRLLAFGITTQPYYI